MQTSGTLSLCQDTTPELHAEISSVHTASDHSCGAQIENKATQLFHAKIQKL